MGNCIMQIHNLFPTPVAFFNLERELTKKELDFLLNQETVNNTGNRSSKNNYILKSKVMTNLRQFIEDSLTEYFVNTSDPKGNINLKITQSWTNYTQPGEYHHKHSHPNSFVSGVFYIKANPEIDKIFFYKDGYQQLRILPKEWNIYNSGSWWLPVGSCQLVLFPSSLTHMVEHVKGDNVRVSLAFNSFPVGLLGEENELTGLSIGETNGT